MNRERLTILRDHLASLPDERFNITSYVSWPDGPEGWPQMRMKTLASECGTAACVAGWANALFHPNKQEAMCWGDHAKAALGLSDDQAHALLYPPGYVKGVQTRQDAIAAVQSMLDSPDDDALPVWPEAGQ